MCDAQGSLGLICLFELQWSLDLMTVSSETLHGTLKLNQLHVLGIQPDDWR